AVESAAPTPNMDAAQVEATDGSSLVKLLQTQIANIQNESAIPRSEEEAHTVMQAKLADLYKTSLLTKVEGMRKKDPRYKALLKKDGDNDEDEDLDEVFGQLSAYDKKEKMHYDKMEAAGYKFTLDTTQGNEAAGRWNRAKEASKTIQEEYKQEKGWKAQKEYRA
ncbi:unnamed protein product, partial [Prorocentrum cordatum]